LAKIATVPVFPDPWEASAISELEKTKPSVRRRFVAAKSSASSAVAVKVFVSHSSKDNDLANALIGLLMAALNLKREKIRCTSVAGSKLPTGADTDQQIRTEVCQARVLIGLLTPASLGSTYVLFELGARWGHDGFLAALLAKGASGSSLVGPMARINTMHAHNEADLHQFLGDVARKLKVKLPNAAAYLTELNHFSQVSKAGDPFVKYEGQRVKVRGEHKKDQYFVHQGRTHYLELSAAEVCENAGLAYKSIEGEEEGVLVSALDEVFNAVQMRATLAAIGLQK
jgi:hypothetical protein